MIDFGRSGKIVFGAKKIEASERRFANVLTSRT